MCFVSNIMGMSDHLTLRAIFKFYLFSFIECINCHFFSFSEHSISVTPDRFPQFIIWNFMHTMFHKITSKLWCARFNFNNKAIILFFMKASTTIQNPSKRKQDFLVEAISKRIFYNQRGLYSFCYLFNVLFLAAVDEGNSNNS